MSGLYSQLRLSNSGTYYLQVVIAIFCTNRLSSWRLLTYYSCSIPSFCSSISLSVMISTRVPVMIKVGDSMYGRFYSMFESPDIMKCLQYVLKIMKSKWRSKNEVDNYDLQCGSFVQNNFGRLIIWIRTPFAALIRCKTAVVS